MKKVVFHMVALLLVSSQLLVPLTLYAAASNEQKTLEQVLKYGLSLGSEESSSSEALSRLELVKLAVNFIEVSLGSEVYIDTNSASPDIDSQAVKKASSCGLLKGKEGGLLDLNGLITHEEAIVILSRAYCYITNKLGEDIDFKSNETVLSLEKLQISAWAQHDIDFLISQKILSPADDVVGFPRARLTQEEAHSLIFRIYTKVFHLSNLGKMKSHGAYNLLLDTTTSLSSQLPQKGYKFQVRPTQPYVHIEFCNTNDFPLALELKTSEGNILRTILIESKTNRAFTIKDMSGITQNYIVSVGLVEPHEVALVKVGVLKVAVLK